MEVRLWRLGPVTPLAFKTSHECCLGVQPKVLRKSTKQQCLQDENVINCVGPSPDTNLLNCPEPPCSAQLIYPQLPWHTTS